MTLAHLDNAQLLAYYETTQGLLVETTRLLYHFEQEVLRRMEVDGATEMVADGRRATASRSVSYDPARLTALLELLPEGELVEAGAYAPEHQETIAVPVKWNATKLKPFSKRGRDVAEAIEKARVLGTPRLKVEAVR